MTKNILVIAAHPDDEVLGCGGAMARHSANGDTVGVLFIADGVGARNDKFVESLQKRKQAAESSLKILGSQSLGFFDFPDNRLDTVPLLDIVQKIEKVIKEFKPFVVYTHHHGDLNIDHAIVHRATMTACRPTPGSCVKEIYAYEVLSSTEWSLVNQSFHPNYFIDIQQSFDKKMLALEIYAEEIPPSPHARSIEAVQALSTVRGASVGLKRAEAFVTLRRVADDSTI